MFDGMQLRDFVEFSPDERIKKMLFEGEHFNIALICLDSGQEIPVHPENYDVFFLVLSGKGIFAVEDRRIDVREGSMVFLPGGRRGIAALERLVVLGVQEPH